MNANPEGAASAFDLSKLIFTAKIDFLTVHTPGKQGLPPLDGRPFWSRTENYRKLSVHDPSPADLVAIASTFDNPLLAELEVAVDIVPHRSVDSAARNLLIDALMVDLIAKGLTPAVVHGDLAFRFRGAFEGTRAQFRLLPFNRRLPSPQAQQLHGRRHDALQVKSYAKKVDQGRDLPSDAHVARVEVRISGDGLHLHNLVYTLDLAGFRYRKRLMPYFRHMKTVRRPRTLRSQTSLLAILQAKQHEFLLQHWQRVGVGTVLPGGRHADADVRLVRNTEVNDRIGQALLRLERRMKFVRLDPALRGNQSALTST